MEEDKKNDLNKKDNNEDNSNDNNQSVDSTKFFNKVDEYKKAQEINSNKSIKRNDLENFKLTPKKLKCTPTEKEIKNINEKSSDVYNKLKKRNNMPNQEMIDYNIFDEHNFSFTNAFHQENNNNNQNMNNNINNNFNYYNNMQNPNIENNDNSNQNILSFSLYNKFYNENNKENEDKKNNNLNNNIINPNMDNNIDNTNNMNYNINNFNNNNYGLSGQNNNNMYYNQNMNNNINNFNNNNYGLSGQNNNNMYYNNMLNQNMNNNINDNIPNQERWNFESIDLSDHTGRDFTQKNLIIEEDKKNNDLNNTMECVENIEEDIKKQQAEKLIKELEKENNKEPNINPNYIFFEENNNNLNNNIINPNMNYNINNDINFNYYNNMSNQNNENIYYNMQNQNMNYNINNFNNNNYGLSGQNNNNMYYNQNMNNNMNYNINQIINIKQQPQNQIKKPELSQGENQLLQQIKNNAIDLEDKELVTASDIESVFPCYFRLFEAETGWLDKNNVDTLVANMCRDENKDLKAYQAVLKKIRDPKEKLCNYTHDEITIMCDIANEITTKIGAVINKENKDKLPKVLLNGDLLSARPLVDGENAYIPLNRSKYNSFYMKKHITEQRGNKSYTIFDVKSNNNEQNKQNTFQETIDKINDTVAITKACADFLIAMNDALNKDALKYGREILKNDNITLLEACEQIFNNSSVDYKQKKEFLKKMNFYNIAGNHDVSLSKNIGITGRATDSIGFLTYDRNATEINENGMNDFIAELKKNYYVCEPNFGVCNIYSKQENGKTINDIDIQKIKLLKKIPFFRSLPVLSNNLFNIFKHTDIIEDENRLLECLTKIIVENDNCLKTINGVKKSEIELHNFYVGKEGDDRSFDNLKDKDLKHLTKEILKRVHLVYGHNASFFKKIREDIIYKLFDKELPDEKWFEDFLKEYEEFISKKYEYNKEHKHDERLKEYIKKQKNIKNFEDLIQQLKKAEERISIDTEFETPDYELVGQEIDKFVEKKCYEKLQSILKNKKSKEYKQLEEDLKKMFENKQICIDIDLIQDNGFIDFFGISSFKLKNGVIKFTSQILEWKEKIAEKKRIEEDKLKEEKRKQLEETKKKLEEEKQRKLKEKQEQKRKEEIKHKLEEEKQKKLEEERRIKEEEELKLKKEKEEERKSKKETEIKKKNKTQKKLVEGKTQEWNNIKKEIEKEENKRLEEDQKKLTERKEEIIKKNKYITGRIKKQQWNKGEKGMFDRKKIVEIELKLNKEQREKKEDKPTKIMQKDFINSQKNQTGIEVKTRKDKPIKLKDSKKLFLNFLRLSHYHNNLNLHDNNSIVKNNNIQSRQAQYNHDTRIEKNGITLQNANKNGQSLFNSTFFKKNDINHNNNYYYNNNNRLTLSERKIIQAKNNETKLINPLHNKYYNNLLDNLIVKNDKNNNSLPKNTYFTNTNDIKNTRLFDKNNNQSRPASCENPYSRILNEYGRNNNILDDKNKKLYNIQKNNNKNIKKYSKFPDISQKKGQIVIDGNYLNRNNNVFNNKYKNNCFRNYNYRQKPNEIKYKIRGGNFLHQGDNIGL